MTNDPVPVLALFLYLAGLALTLGWRTYRQWVRTGDSGLRLAAGPVWSVRWLAKVVFLVALLLGLLGPVVQLAGLAPVSWLDTFVVRILGALLAGVGLVVTLAAQMDLGASWRVGVDPEERTALVTDGAFGIVRNPIFSAMLLSSAGLALLTPNIVSLVATVTLAVAVQLQVRVVEEPYLARQHGAAFSVYAARTGRFVPRFARAAVAPARS